MSPKEGLLLLLSMGACCAGTTGATSLYNLRQYMLPAYYCDAQKSQLRSTDLLLLGQNTFTADPFEERLNETFEPFNKYLDGKGLVVIGKDHAGAYFLTTRESKETLRIVCEPSTHSEFDDWIHFLRVRQAPAQLRPQGDPWSAETDTKVLMFYRLAPEDHTKE